MSHPTCSTCRFMAMPRDEDVWDDATEEMVPDTRATCVRIIHGNRDSHAPFPSVAQPAMVVDGSGYSARLLVLPTFGCNLHEPKERP